MDEILNEFEEPEFDEETLKRIARKYKAKAVAAVFTLIIALIAIAFSIFVFSGNCKIAGFIGSGQTLTEEGQYSNAISEYTSAEDTAKDMNSFVPVFRTGDKGFWGHLELYEKLYGPVECKKLLNEYYPDSKYPQKAKKFLDNEKWFSKASAELNIFVYKTAKDYAEAYEGIERIASENPDYPEYVVLYFHLLATQRFDESAGSQIAAYNALEKSAPDEAWLYAQAGTKALIKNNELTKALRLCPEDSSEESRAMQISIYRMIGEYKEAGMLYDEYRDFNDPSEKLDREKLILSLLEGDARTELKALSHYTDNLNNCKTNEMLYTLQIAAIKASDKNLEKKITDYIKSRKIPQSNEVSAYRLGELSLTDIFLNGGSDLS